MSDSIHVLTRIGMPAGDSVPVIRRRFSGSEGLRVAIVAGIRGDTPEGMRVAHQVCGVLEGCHARLNGTVDVYPCVNPLAAHRAIRNWPFFDQDLNRLFPGRPNGHAPDVVAYALTQDVRGADIVIEMRGAHPSFAEAPQAHVRRGDTHAAELAKSVNVNVVWARDPSVASTATFAAQFQGVISLEGGTGNRLTSGVGKALGEGILNLLNVVKVLPDSEVPFHWATMQRPLMVEDSQVHRIRTARSGFFLPEASPWDTVASGDVIGRVVDPSTGALQETVLAPLAGKILAVREQPVVFSGSMVIRMVEQVDE